MARDRQGKVSVWLGKLDSSEQLDEYLHERYDNDRPISRFAHDLGVGFYDHDLLETGFDAKAGTLHRSLLPHSWSWSYIDDVVAAARQVGLLDVNTWILFFGIAYEASANGRFAGGRLSFLGVFDYYETVPGPSPADPKTRPVRFVRHPKCPAWGVGRVLNEDKEHVLVHFEVAGLKRLQRSACRLAEVAEDEVPSSSALRDLR